MLLRFFETLREYRVPVSLREVLDLNTAMRAHVAFADLDAFYFLSRLCLVKDERYFDRFDAAFARFFDGITNEALLFEPESWTALARTTLQHVLPRVSDEELADALRDYEQMVRELRERQPGDGASDGDGASNRDIHDGARPSRDRPAGEPGDREPAEGDDEQRERHDHGDRGKGDGDGDTGEGEGDDGESGDEGDSGEDGEDGDSGSGDSGKEGDDGEGERGRGRNGREGEGSGEDPGEGERNEDTDTPQRSAVKVWLMREYRDYDPDVELGTRNLKMALRRLRRFTRSAAELELDLHDTIACTARNGGILDIRMVPERHNAVKVLLLLDVGGSMDEHIEVCAQLFSAARTEFKHLEFYYFHNFIYETVWTDNTRRGEDRLRMIELFRTYHSDYKVILVGDALMGQQEITEVGGSVEHYNAVSGEAWLREVRDRFRKVAWLNPVPRREWEQQPSIRLTRRLMEDHMYHLSPEGLEEAMKYLAR